MPKEKIYLLFVQDHSKQIALAGLYSSLENATNEVMEDESFCVLGKEIDRVVDYGELVFTKKQ